MLAKNFAKYFDIDRDYSFIKNINLNFGPQHPAAHGVLRLILSLNKELIKLCDPHIGLLHRGTEKLIEQKIYIHSLPYFDRLDYVSTLVQENVYCTSIERLCKNTTNSLFLNTRTCFDELTRILNHLLAVSCHALDVGSMSTIFWAFEEREKIMEFYERLSGARMHTALYKPNLFNKSITKTLSNDIDAFCKNFNIVLNDMHNVLTNNKVWKIRLFNVASFKYNSAISSNLTGVLLRSTGVKKDVRISEYTSYNNYSSIVFNSFVSFKGDSYDRYVLRMMEMLESIAIITQSLELNSRLKYFNKESIFSFYKKKFMEGIIKHFKYWSSGFKVVKDCINTYVESPKGEFSIFLLADGSEKPYRCKIKSPSYNHLQYTKYISSGYFLSDLVAIIGTIDIVFGEVDR